MLSMTYKQHHRWLKVANDNDNRVEGAMQVKVQTFKLRILTSTGIVSPGKTNTESPTRISSVGTSTQIESEQSTFLVEDSLSDELITSLD